MFLAHQIRISEILPWDRKSYLTHASTVGNMFGNRCESDCRSRGPELDPGPVPYFRGD